MAHTFPRRLSIDAGGDEARGVVSWWYACSRVREREEERKEPWRPSSGRLRRSSPADVRKPLVIPPCLAVFLALIITFPDRVISHHTACGLAQNAVPRQDGTPRDTPRLLAAFCWSLRSASHLPTSSLSLSLFSIQPATSVASTYSFIALSLFGSVCVVPYIVLLSFLPTIRLHSLTWSVMWQRQLPVRHNRHMGPM